MPELRTRRMEWSDGPSIQTLLDEALGRGFWNPATDLEDIVLVAVADDVLVGVASACVEPVSSTSASPVGCVRLVAVDPSARRHGIATRLVSELSELCEAQGAQSLVAYAWVHADVGLAPLAAALERNGYVFDRRVEDFYRDAATDRCPACGLSPCVCPADVYRRTAGRIRS